MATPHSNGCCFCLIENYAAFVEIRLIILGIEFYMHFHAVSSNAKSSICSI